MLPDVPARELQPNNMIENVNAVQENHEEVELDQLQPLQGMMDGEDEEMSQMDNQHSPDQQPLNQQDRQQEVLKSAGTLPKGEGPIVQVLDSICRREEQSLQVLRGVNLACSICGKLLLNGVHSTVARLNKKFAIEQIETKCRGPTLESQFYPELESHLCTWLGNQLSDAIKRKQVIDVQHASAGVMLTPPQLQVLFLKTWNCGRSPFRFIRKLQV